MMTFALMTVLLAPGPADTKPIKAELLKKHGNAHKARIERGVNQVAAMWRPEDGDLGAFAREHFIADPAGLDALFVRFQTALEQIDGHLLEIGRELRRPVEVEMGPMLPVDPLFAAWSPTAHLIEDMFQ